MMKSEATYAVIRVGGQQFKVREGDTIVVDRVGVEEGESLKFDSLAVRTAGDAIDTTASAQVEALVDEHLLGDKIKVFTYKPKSTFKKTKGHRSRLSKLTIQSITLASEKE